jgi:hypothetical protein
MNRYGQMENMDSTFLEIKKMSNYVVKILLISQALALTGF